MKLCRGNNDAVLPHLVYSCGQVLLGWLGASGEQNTETGRTTWAAPEPTSKATSSPSCRPLALTNGPQPPVSVAAPPPFLSVIAPGHVSPRALTSVHGPAVDTYLSVMLRGNAGAQPDTYDLLSTCAGRGQTGVGGAER